MPKSDPGALEGQTIGSYRILGMLGAGGMGVVYKAVDTRLDRTVALKFISQRIEDAGKVRNRFLQEARAASGLDHPNIGTIHGIEEAPDGRLFIVMAYYEGETLAQRIRRGPIPAEQAIQIAIQIARGLAEAHAHNIVHRDIKPSNVILNPAGLSKIVDFGLARMLTSSNSTETAAISGTAAYMAPEQATGRTVDQRADVWALGIVLWEMLTGRLPFQGESAPAMLFAIVNNAPGNLPDDVPVALQAILYRALAKDPDLRYANCKELLADLVKCQPNVDTSATERISARALKRLAGSASGAGAAKPSRWRWWALGGLTAAAIVGTLLTSAVREIWLSPHRPTAKHIAVLPFENAGNDPGNQALTDGLLENLTNRLSNLETGNSSLWVVPASEVRRRKVTDPAAALREFGANLVITGTVQRDTSGIHLALHVVDPAKMRQLGGETLDESTGDLAALQTRAVSTIASLMKIPISKEDAQDRAGSTQPAAYESYVKALGYLQRYDKPGNADKAIDLLEEAVKSDGKFAVGYAELGKAYLLKYNLDQNPRWLELAASMCKRAAELDNKLAPVFVTLGRMHSLTGKFDLAAQEFQRSLDLDPRGADALLGLAGVYERQGRVQDAAAMFERAAALRPDYWDGYGKLGLFYLRQKRFTEAAAQFRRVIELTPDNSLGYLNLGAALQMDSKYPEAAEAFKKALAIAPSYAGYSNLGANYYRRNLPADAIPYYEKALKLNENDYQVWTNLGLSYSWLTLKGDRSASQKARDAFEHTRKLLEPKSVLEPNDADLHDRLAYAYAFLGQRENAIRQEESAAALGLKPFEVQLSYAEIHALLGDRKQARQALESAISQGARMDQIQRDPAVQSILTDPEFKTARW